MTNKDEFGDFRFDGEPGDDADRKEPERDQEKPAPPPARDELTSPSEAKQLKIPREMPLLPVRDVVVFPFMILPLFVGREGSVAAVNDALSRDRMIVLAAQKEMTEENPAPDGIYPMGTVAMIMRMLKLPDGRVKILVQGLARARIEEFTQPEQPFAVKLEVLEEPATEPGLELEALVRNIKEGLEKLTQLGKVISPDLAMVLETLSDPGRFADGIARMHPALERNYRLKRIMTRDDEDLERTFVLIRALSALVRPFPFLTGLLGRSLYYRSV